MHLFIRAAAVTLFLSLVGCGVSHLDVEAPGSDELVEGEQPLVVGGRSYALATTTMGGAAIGCGANAAFGPRMIGGFEIKGRIRCAYEWLERGNSPDVWRGFGSGALASSEQGQNPWFNRFTFAGDTRPTLTFGVGGPYGSDGWVRFTYFREEKLHAGQQCAQHAECDSGVCRSGVCTAKVGEACQNHSLCASGFCMERICTACDGQKYFVPKQGMTHVVQRCRSAQGEARVTASQHFPCNATHTHGTFYESFANGAAKNGCQVRQLPEAVRCVGGVSDLAGTCSSPTYYRPELTQTAGVWFKSQFLMP